MSRMTLKAIESGRREAPLRLLVYGPEGVGKSSLAAGAPSPVFICPSDGVDRLDVNRFPTPATWAEVLEALESLEGKHSYKTIVLDELGGLEALCWEHVCKKERKASIEKFGYGKGYSAAADEWRALLAQLEHLVRKRGLNVILVGHSHVRTFANPEGDSYDRYELRLHKHVAGLLKEWVEAVLFARYEDAAAEGADGKVKGVSTGSRVIHTQHRAAFEAKNRFNLPEELPLDWGELEAAIADRQASAVGDMLAELDKLKVGLKPADQKKLDKYAKGAGTDADKLSKCVNWARNKQEKKAS